MGFGIICRLGRGVGGGGGGGGGDGFKAAVCPDVVTDHDGREGVSVSRGLHPADHDPLICTQ